MIAIHVFLCEGCLRLMYTAMKVDKGQLTGKEKNMSVICLVIIIMNIFRKC